MFKFMMCKTKNPLGEVIEYDIPDLHDAKSCWLNFFTKNLDKFSAGASLYILDDNGVICETLANWQDDGKNCFNYLGM